MSDSSQIIPFDEGWNNQIKAKALDPLEVSYSSVYCLNRNFVDILLILVF
jgi:hypothetical protein